MNYQIKYYFNFKDVKNQLYKLEILENIPTGQTITPIQIIGDYNPVVIDYPNINNKFEPVRGSGIELNLISKTNMQFISLYAGDMLQFKIRVYKDGDLFWLGYLDSELFRESFNNLTNYPVNFTGSDGFALLDRLNYVEGIDYQDINSYHYGGIISHWDMIMNILNKLNLEYKNIYVSLSTTSSQITLNQSLGETLLHKSLSIQNNYYNEDNEPMTCREVLESILRPYGAFIQQINGNIYISDINTISDYSPNYYKYNRNGVYLNTTTQIDQFIGDLSSIGFTSNNSTFSLQPAINKQVINYSPYRNTKLLEYEASANDWIGSGATPTQYGIYGQAGSWKEQIFFDSKNWYNINGGRYCTSFDKDDKVDEHYLKIIPNSEPNDTIFSFIYNKPLPYIIPTTKKNYKLKMKMSAFFRTSDIQPTTERAGIYYGVIKAHLRIGSNKKLVYDAKNNSFMDNVFTGTFKDDSFEGDGYYPKNFEIPFVVFNKETALNEDISNQWVELMDWYISPSEQWTTRDFLIDFNPSIIEAGELSFEIYEAEAHSNFMLASTNITNTVLKDVRIKNLSFELVNPDGSSIERADVEYVGYINPSLKSSGNDIKLIQGTNIEEFCSERGGFMRKVIGNTFLTSWTREGYTDIIENLLMRSIVSNYSNPSQTINCSINQLPTLLGYVKYNNFLPNKKFMISGCKRNLSENEDEVTIIEVVKDSLTVNKNW